MTFDADCVRIELHDAMSFSGDTALGHRQIAQVWLGDGAGKITRRRKPDATVVDDTRAGVLRQLADWIESQDDPSLTILALAIKAGREVAS